MAQGGRRDDGPAAPKVEDEGFGGAAASQEEDEPRCSLCFVEYTGYGNSSLPLASGRCCDTCNVRVVLFRMSHLRDNLSMEPLQQDDARLPRQQ